METTQKHERLGAVVERQMVVPTWLRLMVEENGEDTMVVSHTRHTFAGSFLLAVEVAR